MPSPPSPAPIASRMLGVVALGLAFALAPGCGAVSKRVRADLAVDARLDRESGRPFWITDAAPAAQPANPAPSHGYRAKLTFGLLTDALSNPTSSDASDLSFAHIIRDPDGAAEFLPVGTLNLRARVATGAAAIELAIGAHKTLEEREFVLTAGHLHRFAFPVRAKARSRSIGGTAFVDGAARLDQCEVLLWLPAGRATTNDAAPSIRTALFFRAGAERELVTIAGAIDQRALWQIPLGTDLAGPWLVGWIDIDPEPIEGDALTTMLAETEWPVELTLRSDRRAKQSANPAIDALQWPATRRRALTFLADTSRAGLTLDLALTAPDTLLAQLSSAAHEALTAREDPWPEGELALALECSTLRTIATFEELPDEVLAILIDNAGAAGRQPASLAEVAAAASDLAALRKQLIDENIVYLQDSALSTRTRALRWLARNGAVIPDYDPAGTRAERRAAIEAFVYQRSDEQ